MAYVVAVLAGTVVAARAEGPGVPSAQVFYAPVQSLEDTIQSHSKDPRAPIHKGSAAGRRLAALRWAGVGGCLWLQSKLVAKKSAASLRTYSSRPRSSPSIIPEYSARCFMEWATFAGIHRSIGSMSSIRPLALSMSGRSSVTSFSGCRRKAGKVSSIQPLPPTLPTDLFVTSPVKYTQGYGSTSIQKEFGSFFAAVGGSATATAYQDIQDYLGNTIDEHSRNGTDCHIKQHALATMSRQSSTHSSSRR